MTQSRTDLSGGAHPTGAPTQAPQEGTLETSVRWGGKGGRIETERREPHFSKCDSANGNLMLNSEIILR